MEYQTELIIAGDSGNPLRKSVLESLAQFRKEWQQLAKSKSLLDVEAPVGLLLYDIVERLMLNPQERYVVLGRELTRETDITVNLSLDLEIQG